MDKSLLKVSGIISIVVGVIYCLSIVGAIIGIPLIIGGIKIKDYASYSDIQIYESKDTILIWTIVFLLFSQISGILLLIFYIDNIGKNTTTNNNNTNTNNTNSNVDNNQNNDKYEELEKIKKLYDEKILTKEEYENEKSRILNK